MQPSATRSPARSLQALLRNALDYAGMFPPASLALDEAIRDYARYRSGPDAWLLSHFICPANRLADLGSRLSPLSHAGPLGVSALGLQSTGPGDFVDRLPDSVQLISSFETSYGSVFRIHAIELALPSDVVVNEDRDEIRRLIDAAAEAIERSSLPAITPFFEAGKLPGTEVTRRTIRAIADHNDTGRGVRCLPAAFKLRTGGVTAEAFPSVEQVAGVISACRDYAVAFKCTAGLHHPIRRYHESVGTEMHGFLNVLAAGVLAHAQSANEVDLSAILADGDPSHFRFDADGLTWLGKRVTLEGIAEARRELIVSFGSCSFEEPLEDLRALGLL